MRHWRNPNKVDANQAEIVKALRKAGCRVQSLAVVGDGCPDLLVKGPDDRIHLFEVKDGAKVPSARKLTEAEQRFADEWRIVKVVLSVEDAIAAVAPQLAPGAP